MHNIKGGQVIFTRFTQIFSTAAAMLILLLTTAAAQDEKITVGSKMDTESYLIAEMISQLLEHNGYDVERKFGLGGTLISYDALREGVVDLYPEYTGTISAVLIEPEERPEDTTNIESYRDALNRRGLEIFSQFGFNNSYVLTMNGDASTAKNIRKMSDLRDHPDLVISLSHEFLNRDDGWPALKQVYGLSHTPTGIQHGLAYKAIDEGMIDITDAYSTDGDIERYGLVFLEDDLDFFPKYYAAIMTRSDFPERARQILSRLENMLDDDGMRALNAKIVIDQQTFEVVAKAFLLERGFIDGSVEISSEPILSLLIKNTMTHIKLTLIALSIGCVIGLSLALAIFRSKKLSRTVIYFCGLMQTIPSIALLALMIPILGIGEVPAIAALFLYSLLPILRSAITALSTIDPVLVNVSRAIGMTRVQQLKNVLIPLALPNIMAGIRTATVICIGTATLAAFIGAGGLGEPIVTGLALNDTNLILQGALPAACLAIIVELMFELLEKKIIPEHMRDAH